MEFFEIWGVLLVGAVFGSWMQEHVPIYGSQRWFIGGLGIIMLVVSAVN